jgi:hypothetical protein
MPVSLLTLLAQAAAAAATPGNHYVPADKLPWYHEAPNIPAELAPLWGDRSKGEAGTYLRVPGHWVAPLHYHTADYWALVVQGEWEHWVPATGEGQGHSPDLRRALDTGQGPAAQGCLPLGHALRHFPVQPRSVRNEARQGIVAAANALALP